MKCLLLLSILIISGCHHIVPIPTEKLESLSPVISPPCLTCDEEEDIEISKGI